MNRTTPIPFRPVGADGVTRWLGGIDLHPTTQAPDGIDDTPVTFTPDAMVDLYPGEGSPKGHLVTLEVQVPAGDDLLWVCFGPYAHARAWPVEGGARFEHTAHMQGIAAVSFRATAADGTSPPSAPINPRIKAEWDRRG